MRTGVFFCQLDDQWNTDIDAIAKYSANLPDVETVQNLGVMPLLDSETLSEKISSRNLERVVIAGDMPGYYKPVFTKAMASSGGNVNEVRLASFMEHGAKNGDTMDRAKAMKLTFLVCLSCLGLQRISDVALCMTSYFRLDQAL